MSEEEKEKFYWLEPDPHATPGEWHWTPEETRLLARKARRAQLVDWLCNVPSTDGPQNARVVASNYLLGIRFEDRSYPWHGHTIYEILRLYHEAQIRPPKTFLLDLLYLTSQGKLQGSIQRLIFLNNWLILPVDKLHCLSANFWRNLVLFSDDELQRLGKWIGKHATQPLPEPSSKVWSNCEYTFPYAYAVFHLICKQNWRELYWMMQLRTTQSGKALFPSSLFTFFANDDLFRGWRVDRNVKGPLSWLCHYGASDMRMSVLLGAFHARVGGSSALYRHFTEGLFGEKYVLELILKLAFSAAE